MSCVSTSWSYSAGYSPVLTLTKEPVWLCCSDLSRTWQLSAAIFALHNVALITCFKDLHWTEKFNLSGHTVIDKEHWERLIVIVGHSNKCFMSESFKSNETFSFHLTWLLIQSCSMHAIIIRTVMKVVALKISIVLKTTLYIYMPTLPFVCHPQLNLW